jgi:hypothetical protein
LTDPRIERTLPREKLKSCGIFGTRLAKTQYRVGRLKPPPPRPRHLRKMLDLQILDLNAILFDCDGEASDQPRQFVQIVKILLPDRVGEPDQALVVTHHRDVTGNDRRGGFHKIGLDVWHLVSSLANPAAARFLDQ